LGFGAAPLGNLYRRHDSDAGIRRLRIEAGIAYFDTAPYTIWISERRVGDALRGHDGIVLSSKVGDC